MQGWIRLYRKLIDWEWYNDSQAVHLFVHFVINANHEDKKWRGLTIKRGQFVSGIYELSKQTGISQQSIRTNIKRLKLTGELTSKSTNRFTIYTIVNYDKFQGNEPELTSKSTSQLTSKQQATNKQLTTNKNEKNEKKDKKEDKEAIVANMLEAHPTLDVSLEYDKMIDWHLSKGRKIKDYAATFRNWCRKAEEYKKEKGTNNGKQSITEQAEYILANI